jgi:hypothetical protein
LHQSAHELDAKPIVKIAKVAATSAAYAIGSSFLPAMMCLKRFPG